MFDGAMNFKATPKLTEQADTCFKVLVIVDYWRNAAFYCKFTFDVFNSSGHVLSTFDVTPLKLTQSVKITNYELIWPRRIRRFN